MLRRGNGYLARQAIAAQNCASYPSPTAKLPPLSVARNFIWTLGGNVIGTGCQWALIVLLAKLASPEIVGEFALASAVAIPITLFANFQLRVLYVTDVSNRYSFQESLGLRFILCCIAVVGIVIACMLARYDGPTTFVILAVGIAQLPDLVSDSYYGLFQRDERMDRIARSLIVRNIISLIAFAVALYFTHRLLWGICGLLVGRSLVLLLYDAQKEDGRPSGNVEIRQALFDRLRPSWNLRSQWQMFWVAFPLAIVSILVSVNGYVPRYLLESFVGRRGLGIYSAINYIPSGCFMVTTALGYSVFAKLSKLFAKGDLAGFKRVLTKLTGIYAVGGAAGILVSVVVGRQLLTIVYRPDYAQHVDLLCWLMIVGAVNCVTTSLQCGLTAASRFRIQVPLFAGITAISLIGCLILIPRMGLIGAAIAVLISSIVQLCASGLLMFQTMVKRARELKNMEGSRLEMALQV
jgi:O-antigen/teichoic acid export membrane protein